MADPRPRLLLVVDSRSYRAGAYLDAARSLDVPVTVASRHPSAMAAVVPDGTLALGASDDRALARIASFAARRRVSAVIGPDDATCVLAARAAAALDLPGSEPASVERARDKRLMRRAMKAAGLPIPWFSTACGDPERLARRAVYPCVVKPTRGSASVGVIRVDGEDELAPAVARCRALASGLELRAEPGDPPVLVEAFLPGAEVALDALVVDGRVVPVALFDKPEAGDGPYFEETVLVTPSRLDARQRSRVLARTQELVAALGLRSGPVHVELRVTGEDAQVIEIAPRTIGGLCARCVSPGGVSLEALVIRQALGWLTAQDLRRVEGAFESPAEARGVLMVPAPRAGRLRAVEGVRDARAVAGIDDVAVTAHRGAWIAPAPASHRYVGFVFARGNDPAAVEAALGRARRHLRIELEPGHQATGPDATGPDATGPDAARPR